MSKELIKQVNNVFKGRVNYRSYDLRKTLIVGGIPPFKIIGLEYIYSQHKTPQTELISCLTSKGVFVNNQNKSGIIEIGIMTGSVSVAGFQVLNLTGIPFPIMATDIDSAATSTVIASACRRVGTPTWRRGRMPGITIFTFATPRLLMSDGLRLTA